MSSHCLLFTLRRCFLIFELCIQIVLSKGLPVWSGWPLIDVAFRHMTVMLSFRVPVSVNGEWTDQSRFFTRFLRAFHTLNRRRLS